MCTSIRYYQHQRHVYKLTIVAVLAADAVGTDTAVTDVVTRSSVHAEGQVGGTLLGGTVATVRIQDVRVVTLTVRVYKHEQQHMWQVESNPRPPDQTHSHQESSSWMKTNVMNENFCNILRISHDNTHVC